MSLDILKRLLYYALCLTSVLECVYCDHWGRWSEWSACSRTCDGGATYQERKCVRSFESKKGCEGERFRYNTCNNEACASDAIDFRTQQCAAYNNHTYGGKLYTWLPYTDRKNPCTLYCIPKGTRTVVRLAPKVLDGTRCKFQSHNMCINGKCWQVGCDHRLDSRVVNDLCGVCGGNNSCMNSARYYWVDIGLSPCSAACGRGFHIIQYRCRDRYTGNQMKDSFCARSPKPKGRQKSCFRKECPPMWKIFPWQTCTKSCGGGVSTRGVRCMKTHRDGRQSWVHDNFCPSPKPSTMRHCNSHMCPRWYAGEWSPCSVTCGWGQQVREVVCRHEGETFCDVSTKPVTKRNCTTMFPCTDSDDPRTYIAEHDENGRQELRRGLPRGGEIPIIREEDLENHDMDTPRFVVSKWGECGATCGVAFKHRYVRCKVFLMYLQNNADLDDAECSDPKPAVTEKCDLPPCYDEFEWAHRGLTPCSRSCLGGVQETNLECVHKTNGSTFPDDHCLTAKKLPISRVICNDKPCPQRWRIGDFGDCSKTCGGGIMIRDVRCIQQTNIAHDEVITLPDRMCSKPIKMRVRECNTQHCPADWASGYWSECNVTCGVGVQLRPVVCQRVTSDGQPIDVDEYNCPPTEKPVSNRTCTMSKCPKIKIKKRKMEFFQIREMDRVKLNVGAQATILPRTLVVLRCPVRGMDRRNVEWLKNGRPLRTKGKRRVSLTKSGNLKIKRTWPGKDTANFTCVAGKHRASVEIVFSGLYRILEEEMKREKYLEGILADEAGSNSTVTMVDPFDKKRRPLQLVISSWSPCSATCGGGIRKRNMTCEIITHNYFEIFPLKVCKKAGLKIPDSVVKCNPTPCIRWVKKSWSECLQHKCVREGYSIKIRTVACIMEHNSSKAPDSMCDKNTKPVSRKECRNPTCQAIWNTSRWSDCLASCGESGYQTRMLTCVWEGNGHPAGRSCHNMGRPILTRQCYNNCTHGTWSNKHNQPIECIDTSDYCSIVPMMKLCRFTSFKKECCHSCNTTPNDPPS